MDWRKYIVLGIPAVIASVLRVIFNLDILISGLVYGISLGITYYISRKMGYWKMPDKES